MAAPIQNYRSTTTGHIPASLLAGQIAINQTDLTLFTANASGAVTLLANGNLWASQATNLVWASPASAAGAPSYRSLVTADIPVLDASKITTGIFNASRLGSGSPSASTYLTGTGWSTLSASIIPAAGSLGDIQFNGGIGLAADHLNLWWDDTNNRLHIGTGGDNSGILALSIYGPYSSYSSNTTISSSGYAPGCIAYSSRGSGVAPTVSLTGDLIGQFGTWAYTGSTPAYTNLACVTGYASGTTSSLGGILNLSTKADGGVLTSRLSISNTGVVTIVGLGTGVVYSASGVLGLALGNNLPATGAPGDIMFNNNGYLGNNDANLWWNNTSSLLNVGCNNDETGTNPINIYNQMDAYMPYSAIGALATDNVTPGYTASSSRGTGIVPTINLTGDLIGGFSMWGYTGSTNIFTPLAGAWAYAAGITSSLGGQYQIYTKADGGNLVSRVTIDNAGYVRASKLVLQSDIVAGIPLSIQQFTSQSVPLVVFQDSSANVWGGVSSNMTPFGVMAWATVAGRLTLSSTDPVIDSVTSSTTLYFLPYGGRYVLLWNSTLSQYELVTIPDAGWSLALTMTANTVYDVYITNGLNNTATITLGTAWTNVSTRAANSITEINGMYFKNLAAGTDKNSRYVGTIRCTATANTCTDSFTQRYLYNHYNQIGRELHYTYNPGGTWTYNSATWRSINSQGVYQVEFLVGGLGMCGQYELAASQGFQCLTSGTANIAISGIAIDQTAGFTNNAEVPGYGGGDQYVYGMLHCHANGRVGPASHWATMLEASPTGTTTYTNGYTGLHGWVWQ